MKAGKTAGLVFFAFDLLFLGNQDLRSNPLVVRKKKLLDLLADNKDQKMIQLAEYLDVAGQDVLKAACNLKLEGIVSKRLSEPYIQGAQASGPRRSAGRHSTPLSAAGLSTPTVQRAAARRLQGQKADSDWARRHWISAEATAMARAAVEAARD